MKKKLTLALAALAALTLSSGILAACGGKTEEPEDYTFTNPPVEGLAEPDEGFVIDGKFDEAAYQDLKWFHGAKVEKDADNLSYDVAKSDIDGAAQVSMAAYFGEKGLYIATNYKAAPDEGLYVNPERRSVANSITELYLALSDDFTSINDIGVCEIDMAPTGNLVFKRKSAYGNFIDYATTNDMMAQLGVSCNGLVGEDVPEGKRATEYSCELFIPWNYVDKIAGEGAADKIKEGGEIRMNVAPITSYNYAGNDLNLDRWWYMMGAQIDNGGWGNVNGWYHFNKDGLVAYDIEIEESEGGTVMERFGHDFAVANNSHVFVAKADEGYLLNDTIEVNGESYNVTYTDGSRRSGYITVPANQVTGKLTVKASFAVNPAVMQAFEADVYTIRLGVKSEIADGATVTLTGADTHVFTVENGKISGEIMTGYYEATISGSGLDDYGKVGVTFDEGEPMGDIAFGKSVFVQGMGTNVTSTLVDDTHANDVNGYVTNVSGNAFFPATIEAFGNSAFTATFKSSMATDNGNNGMYLRYIFDGTTTCLMPTIKMYNGNLIFQWKFERNASNAWGYTSLEAAEANDKNGNPLSWAYEELSAAALEAFRGDGLDMTMVRSGDVFHVFVAIHATGEIVGYNKATLTGTKPSTGHWAISIENSAGNNTNVFFKLEDTQEAVDAWLEKLEDTSGEKSFTASVSLGKRFGKDVSSEGGTVKFVGIQSYEFTVSGGSISGKLQPGTYTVSFTKEGVSGGYVLDGVSFDGTTLGALAFTYDAFTQGMGTNVTSTLIDDTHANDENGYVTNVSGSAFFPATNEAFGESVFTATFKASMATDNGNNGMYLRYIFDGTKTCLMPTIKMYSGNLIFQWKFERNSSNAWGYTSLEAAEANDKNDNPLSWAYESLSEQALEAFRGDGLDMTMVRSGDVFHVFVAIHATGEIVGYNKATLTGTKPATGHWAISIENSAGNNTDVFFKLDDTQAAVNTWLEKLEEL